MIEYRVLGTLGVGPEAGPIDVKGHKRRLLLATLLAHANTRVSGDRLIDAVWGDQPADGITHTLQVHISNLRQLLEPGHVRGEAWSTLDTVGDGYVLYVEEGALDRDRFEQFAAEGRLALEHNEPDTAAALLGEALALWSGPAFGDLADELPLVAEARRLEELRLESLEARIEADLQLGRHTEVTAELGDLVEAHPFRERLRGQQMLALYRAGRQAEALRAYQALARSLGEELGITPGTEVSALEKQILFQDPSLDLAKVRGKPPSNLPGQVSSFVGREQDLAGAARSIGQTRLLTYTGPGGVGKTRLASEAATAALDAFADGVWFVALASLRDPTLVSQAVAEVLDVDQQPGQSVEETIAAHLRDRSLLLVLDNCEHLIEACATLVDLLVKRCPNLTVWATSREPLGVSGESQLRVGGLPLPTAPDLGVDDVAMFDSVRLFTERAVACDASFALTDDNAPALARICTRLDGIPLAIELAAARVTMLSPTQIAAALDRRFELLTTGSRTGDERHQTLRAAMDWSHELLTDPERTVFRRLSVFRGTFDLEAVQAVCGEVGDTGSMTFDLVGMLVAKSLVAAVSAGEEVRYQVLETIRLYGREKLEEMNEGEEVLGRHRGHFVALAEEAGSRLRGSDQLVWLRRLEANHDNLRAVLERSHAAGDATTALRVAGSIAWFWFLHSHLAEGWDWIERLIAVVGGSSERLRLRLLIAAAQFAWEQSEDDRAEQWLEQAAELARSVGSRTHAGWALANLALLATLRSQWEEARDHATAALELFQSTGNVAGAGFTLWVQAAASYLPTRESAHETGPTGVVEQVEMLLEPARQLGDRNFLGHVLWSLAIVACDERRRTDAESYLSEALVAFAELGNKSCTGHTLDEAARLAVLHHDGQRGARLLGATEALRSRLGVSGHTFERNAWAQCRRMVQEALDEDAFDAAWIEGRSMNLDQAIAYAQSGLGAVPSG